MRLPEVIGHRGAAGHAPENTLASIRKAAELGCAWVEFDVKSTADGALILMHDAELDRTTDRAGFVANTPLAALASADAGAWFAPEFAGEPIPRFETALALCRALGLAINVEIKPCPGREIETAEAVCAALAGPPPGDLLLSSFEEACIERCLALRPDLPRAFVTSSPPDDLAALLDRLDCFSLHLEHRLLVREPGWARAAGGRPIMAYTVNEVVDGERARAAGAACLCSDRPDQFLASAG